jgi:hypothetical protein
VRTSISKSTRFEVFKRDSFTCQYCGGKAPDILLEIDHIEPVAKGGRGNILNLITSCKDCNGGKSDRRLSDTAVLEKQRAQLAELQKRREQIEMMFQWQKGLMELQDGVVDQLREIWEEHVPGFFLNETGIRGLKKLHKTYPVDEIISAIRIAADQYLDYQDGTPTKDSAEIAWKKVGGICRMARLERENPDLRRLYYIRGILRNRFSYCNDGLAMELLRRAHDLNASISSMEEFAKTAPNWTTWRSGMEDYITEHKSPEPDEPATQKGT